MRYAVRLVVCWAMALAACSAQAFDRSQCKQYGGPNDCWTPILGDWTYRVCGEIGTFLSYDPIAWCRAQGGTWNGSDCEGLPPPELRRPTSEADMQPFAVDWIKEWQGPFCEGPTADPYSWGGVFYSPQCWGQVNGASYTKGYESANTTTPFLVHGKKQTTECSTTESSWTYSGRRERSVNCSGAKGASGEDFYWTSGATPSLCRPGIRLPINPKQPCDGCKSVHKGNPIDINSGVKRQVELDYAASGPFPLRFERVYNSRIYTRDGRQWRHNYSAHIEHQDFGSVPVAAAHRPSGQLFHFKSVAGVYTPDTDINDRITKLVDGGGALTGWEYYDAATENTELYDAAGKLLSITNRAGLSHTLAYSTGATPPGVAPGPGYLIKVTDAFGRELNFTYDALGRMASMQDPAGQTYAYTSTSQGHVATLTYPDGRTRTYVYNETALSTINIYEGRLTGIIDENNSRFSSYYYNGFGIATRSVLAGGANDVQVNTNSGPWTIHVTDALGTLRTYSYGTANNVYVNTTITQPKAVGTGTVQSAKGYDANGNVTFWRDFNGNRTNYTYDISRNLETSRTEGLTATGATTPYTRTISTQWDTNFRLPTAIAEPLRMTTNIYDPDGALCGARAALCSRTIQATADANGSQAFSATPTGSPRTWSYTYNSNGSILTMNGPRADVADVTSYTYYLNDDPEQGKRGNLASVTNTAGHLTSITAYNAHGQPLTIIDPNAVVTSLAYDERRRLTSREVGAELTSYEYDGVGQLTKVTLPDGSFLSYTYDAAHRLTGMQDNLGNKILYTLDAMGNRTLEEVRDPGNNLAQTRSRVFNNLNRLFQEIGAASQTTQYVYDNQGNVTSVDGPLAGTGDVTANAYDALNRLRQVTNPGSVVTQYAYNGLDALTQVIDPRNLVTGYTVDGLGNLTQQASPDTGNTVNTYDPAGNLLTQTDAKGQVSTYAYDALNRVTSITFHDGSRQTYVYDAGMNGLGRLASIAETDPAQQVTSLIVYGYDPHGRVTSESRTVAGVPYVTAYRYDSAGRRDRITYPSGRTVDFTFDTVGRVNSVSTTPSGGGAQAIATGIGYHPFGGVTGFTFGNAQTYSRAVDQDGRIRAYSLGAAGYDLSFDSASRITGIAQTGNPPNTNAYGYDALDRLTSAVLPFTTYGYTYDGVGNRLTKVAGAGTDTYTYSSSSNRIASVTPSSGPMRGFTFDSNGSTTADGINTYTYDTRGRMVQAVSSLGTTTYQVNALGQRVRKTNSLGDKVFHYDAQGHLIAETTAAGATLQEYIWLGDMPLAMVNGTDRYYIHADHLNTPRLVADATGTTVWRWDQAEPFGNNPADEDPDANSSAFDLPLRLPGQRYDKETGLAYNMARDYDSGLGRYIQSDPLGIATTTSPTATTSLASNLYLYALGRPTSVFDPDGREVQTCCGMTSALPDALVMVGLECMSTCLNDTIYISSGTRTPDQNIGIPGAAPESQHLTGLAADVHIPPSKSKIRRAAAECGFFVLAKDYPKHVHVDLRNGINPKIEPDECICQQIRSSP